MYIQNRMAAFVFRLAAACLCLLGILPALGVGSGTFYPKALLYFTLLSNVFCFFYLVWDLFHTGRDLLTHKARPTPHFHWKGAALGGILITLFIYQFLLAPTPFSMSPNDTSLGNLLLHLITPLLFLLDYLLFDPKGRTRWFDPFLWAIFPYLYVAFALIAGSLSLRYPGEGSVSSHYPYFFLDVDAQGLPQVLLNVLVLTIVFLLFFFLLVLLDHLLFRVSSKGKKNAK